MLAPIEYIAGQSADRKVRSPEQHQDQANANNHQPQPEQHLTYFGHNSILKGKAFAEAKAW